MADNRLSGLKLRCSKNAGPKRKLSWFISKLPLKAGWIYHDLSTAGCGKNQSAIVGPTWELAQNVCLTMVETTVPLSPLVRLSNISIEW